MSWKQFLTPVASMNALEAKKFIQEQAPEKITLLDVRQPKEYKQGHIAGAKLLPLTELSETYHQLDPQKPTIVYCAVGGRSRIAAQMLAAKGFSEVYNLSGGMKAWNSDTAFGGKETGMQYFTGKEAAEEILIIAFGLETGLRAFYLSRSEQIGNPKAASLFIKMADIEVHHQEKIVREYNRITNNDRSVADFEKELVNSAMEGGLTTEEYAAVIGGKPETPQEVIELAMSIEAQALDLYMRAADNSSDETSRKVLLKIAGDERAHLNRLGELLEELL